MSHRPYAHSIVCCVAVCRKCRSSNSVCQWGHKSQGRVPLCLRRVYHTVQGARCSGKYPAIHRIYGSRTETRRCLPAYKLYTLRMERRAGRVQRRSPRHSRRPHSGSAAVDDKSIWAQLKLKGIDTGCDSEKNYQVPGRSRRIRSLTSIGKAARYQQAMRAYKLAFDEHKVCAYTYLFFPLSFTFCPFLDPSMWHCIRRWCWTIATRDDGWFVDERSSIPLGNMSIKILSANTFRSQTALHCILLYSTVSYCILLYRICIVLCYLVVLRPIAIARAWRATIFLCKRDGGGQSVYTIYTNTHPPFSRLCWSKLKACEGRNKGGKELDTSPFLEFYSVWDRGEQGASHTHQSNSIYMYKQSCVLSSNKAHCHGSSTTVIPFCCKSCKVGTWRPGSSTRVKLQEVSRQNDDSPLMLQARHQWRLLPKKKKWEEEEEEKENNST